MRKPITAVLLVASLIAPNQFAIAEGDSATKKMVLAKTISGAIAPKSVLASNQGLVSAHNMMYRYSVTIYDANSLELTATVADSVDLSKLLGKTIGSIGGASGRFKLEFLSSKFISG